MKIIQTKILKITTKHKLAVILFFVAFFLRLYKLGEFPIGITHDELNYVMAAKSLFSSGAFVPGTAPTVLITNMQSFSVVIAEVPALILALAIGWLKHSLLASRILGAALGSGVILLIYLLSLELFKDKALALTTMAVAVINPWSFLMSRTIFEVNFFNFFFLLGFLVLLRTKEWRIFLAFPFYLLGFLSYTGGQVSFFLFIILTLAYKYLTGKNQKKAPFGIFALITSGLLVGFVVLVLQNQAQASRGGELYLPTSNQVAATVDAERKLSVPSPLNKLFVNKATVYINGFTEKYLTAFSVEDLFIRGEFRAAFSYIKHGTFYFVDSLFIVLGLGYLFVKKRREWLFLLLAIGGSVVTSGLSIVELSYSQRSGMMYPFLIMFVGAGILYFIQVTSKIKKAPIAKILLSVTYFLLFANLLHLYFYRFPVYASDGWFHQDRLLSQYIQLAKQKEPERKITITTFEPKIVFQEYLFYGGYYEGEQIKKINASMGQSIYVHENVSFINTCGKPVEDGVLRIFDGELNCREQQDTSVLRITRNRDTLAKYQIEGDSLCASVELGRYVHPISYSNFDPSNLTPSDFCRTWITKL